MKSAQEAVNPPGLIVGSGSDTATDEDDLRLHEHLLARGEDGAVGDHEILDDLRVGDDAEELVTEPHRIERAEFLGPFVERQLSVVGQEGERAYSDALCQNAPEMTDYRRNSPRMGRPQGPGGKFLPPTVRRTNLKA